MQNRKVPNCIKVKLYVFPWTFSPFIVFFYILLFPKYRFASIISTIFRLKVSITPLINTGNTTASNWPVFMRLNASCSVAADVRHDEILICQTSYPICWAVQPLVLLSIYVGVHIGLPCGVRVSFAYHWYYQSHWL